MYSEVIDLRSDTVTFPTEEMRKAMYEAEIGDDVYGEDPTVNLLQERMAEKAGKEAGLFVSSGTQGNLISILTQTNRGDEVLLGDQSHIFNYEAGGISVLGGLVMFPIANNVSGGFDIEVISSGVNPLDNHRPKTRLLCIENSHAESSGQILNSEQINIIAREAEINNLKLHIDGARLFNAAVALNVSLATLSQKADSVSICLSKGLSCPMGSIVCGNNDFIEEAGRWRKMLGGGCRQIGVVAAAGLVALDSMIERLSEDHENARILAQFLCETVNINLNINTIHTNIIKFTVKDGLLNEFVGLLRESKILVGVKPPYVRMVTHYGITLKEINHVKKSITSIMRKLG